MPATPNKQITPAIEMDAVTVSAREDSCFSVLEDVDWKVMPGEYWVLGGMHNSGKSDLLALAAGLNPPQKGTYRLFGARMPSDLGGPERSRVGLVFDGGRPFHRLSIEENIELPLLYHHVAGEYVTAERTREILDLTGLSPWAERQPGTIGRSWEKRLGLARALVLRPELLLLDDPLGGLDSRHLSWWMNFLDELSAGHPFLDKRPVTIVVAAHNLQPWQHQRVRLTVLKQKRFEVLGPCSDMSLLSDSLVRELLAGESTVAV